MNTFLKSFLSRVFGDGVRVLVFFVIVVIVGAVVADRAIRQGKNVELNVASFLTLTATTPATTGREPHSAAVLHQEETQQTPETQVCQLG